MNKVYIIGLGAISSIGNNVEENYQSLLQKKSGIGKMQFLDSELKTTLPIGEVKLSNAQLLQQLQLDQIQRPYARTALLGMMAAREAYQTISKFDIGKYKIGLYSGTSVGGMDRGEQFYQYYKSEDYQQYIDLARVHDCGESTECIADFLGIKYQVNTISTACSSAANAIMRASKLIRHGMLDIALAGGTDAMSLFTINGFNSLKILSESPCKPFDKDRNGLNLGEGAGYVLLVSERVLKKYDLEPLATVSGYGNACDAYHQTASSADGQGAWLSMREAIATSQIDPTAIGYINAHGTSTVNNDLSEGIAFKRIFSNYIPPFSSTKAYTGHTLAASGGIEAVYSVMALKNKKIYPNLNFETTIDELGFAPIQDVTAVPELKHVLSNAFGFGGNNTSLIFSSC